MGRKELFKLQVTSLDGIPDLDLHTHSLRSHDVILISPHPLRSLADTLAPPVFSSFSPSLTYYVKNSFDCLHHLHVAVNSDSPFSLIYFSCAGLSNSLESKDTFFFLSLAREPGWLVSSERLESRVGKWPPMEEGAQHFFFIYNIFPLFLFFV